MLSTTEIIYFYEFYPMALLKLCVEIILLRAIELIADALIYDS